MHLQTEDNPKGTRNTLCIVNNAVILFFFTLGICWLEQGRTWLIPDRNYKGHSCFQGFWWCSTCRKNKRFCWPGIAIIIYINVFTILVGNVKPCFVDTRLICTPHYYSQFALSLGKETPYIFSKFNPLNKDSPLTWTCSIGPSVSVLMGIVCSWRQVGLFRTEPIWNLLSEWHALFISTSKIQLCNWEWRTIKFKVGQLGLCSINQPTVSFFFSGLSLRAGAWGFPLATVSMTPGYFCRKQKENGTKRTSWLFSFPPTKCIYLATWNLSESPSFCASARDHCCVLCDKTWDLLFTWYIVHQP